MLNNAILNFTIEKNVFLWKEVRNPMALTTENEDIVSGGVALAEREETYADATIAVREKEETEIRVKGGKVYAFFKRALDIFASLSAIIVFGLPMLIIGILVKCTSKGPMIYVSDRVGQGGRVFHFYKFRSMYKDAEDKLGDLLPFNESEGITFKMKDDPRITSFGKFLRKTSLDELPQLFNILKGDMSIVGPRPCTVREFSLYGEREKQRLSVPQGLTGEWQAKGRSSVSFDQMIDMDLDYISNKRSFGYDLRLIFKTIVVVITEKGAE